MREEVGDKDAPLLLTRGTMSKGLSLQLAALMTPSTLFCQSNSPLYTSSYHFSSYLAYLPNIVGAFNIKKQFFFSPMQKRSVTQNIFPDPAQKHVEINIKNKKD